MRTTHTLAVMHLPADVVELIRGKLAEAGYDHAIDEDDGLLLDMTGIGLAVDEDELPDHLPDDIEVPDDTPSLANCDDAGTGEGRWHGRI